MASRPGRFARAEPEHALIDSSRREALGKGERGIGVACSAGAVQHRENVVPVDPHRTVLRADDANDLDETQQAARAKLLRAVTGERQQQQRRCQREQIAIADHEGNGATPLAVEPSDCAGMKGAIERCVQLDHPLRPRVGGFDREHAFVNTGADPVLLVRRHAWTSRTPTRRLKRCLSAVHLIGRDEDIDVGHAPDARLLEVGARRVKPLEHDGHDIRGDHCVERGQDLAFHPSRAPTRVAQLPCEAIVDRGRGRDALCFQPATEQRTHSRCVRRDG